MLFRLNTHEKRPLKLFQQGVAVRKLYVHENDLPSFPNRIVFNVTGADVADVLAATFNGASGPRPEWYMRTVSEATADSQKAMVLVAPFSIAHRNATIDTGDARPIDHIKRGVFRPMSLYIGGRQVPNVCVACRKAAKFSGNCPDFDDKSMSLQCLGSDHIEGDLSDVFYLDEKGGLVYGSVSDVPE